MILCRVVGNAVSSVQHPAYRERTVLVLRPVAAADPTRAVGDEFLAVDAVQAGVGDLVLAAREGSTARQLLGSDDDPFHSVVLGIVDLIVLTDGRPVPLR